MEPDIQGSEKTILVRFRINKKDPSSLTEKEIEKFRNDLKDLGKLRIIKQGRGFLKK